MLFKTPLEKSILNWINNKGDLSDYLKDLRDYKIVKKKDAQIIVKALTNINYSGIKSNENKITSPLHTLTAYFQQVGSQRAYRELKTNGIPELIRLFKDCQIDQDFQIDLEFVLKILAMYEHEDGTKTVLEAASNGFASEGYLWSVIFDRFSDNHIHKSKVIDHFREKLPIGFIAIGYLDFVNSIAINEGIESHPFNSDDGIEKLKGWLSDTNPDNASYAHSATAALPFLDGTIRNELLKLAIRNPDAGVQMEAAWASGKIGNREGIDFLIEKAKDVKFSSIACEYLRQLGKESEIPIDSKNPNFQAMAEMCTWLAHPHEFGKVPNEIVLYDTRELKWPPTNDVRQVWLFKYTYNPTEEDEEIEKGISMVGSVTFALFGEVTENLTPEEVYALHCCWELEMNQDSRAPKERSIEAGKKILSRSNIGFE